MSGAGERSEIQWGTVRIEYGIERSGRRKTVGVTVAPPGRVLLTAPRGVAVERLDAVVRAKAGWITSRLRRVRPREPGLGPREFLSGEGYLYLGRQYRLAVQEEGEGVQVRLERGRLRVRVPRGVEGRERVIREALTGWYREHARERLTEQVAGWAVRMGQAVPRVQVREQERRWGSCSGGVVRFNWRIIQAPMRLVEYVVAHELVHLEHEAHGKAFWAALGRLVPDYEARREQLRTTGPRLLW